MDEQSKLALSHYRLEEAYDNIETAQLLVEHGKYKSAANRSYYAMFHCIRSILALDSKDFKKHSAVSAYFRKEYIKTGLFEKPSGR